MKIIEKLSDRLAICEYGEHSGTMHIFSKGKEYIVDKPIVDVPRKCFSNTITSMIIHIPSDIVVEVGDCIEFN